MATSLVVVVTMQCPIIRRANSQSPEISSDLARSPLICYKICGRDFLLWH